MTPAELRLYKLLQPAILKRMKPEIWDRCYDIEHERQGVITAVDPNRLDYIDEDGEAYTAAHDDILLLPLPIDPDRPERGLWGMILRAVGDTTSYSLTYVDIEIEDDPQRRHNMRIFREQTEEDLEPFNDYDGATPTEALLLALAQQEGVKA